MKSEKVLLRGMPLGMPSLGGKLRVSAVDYYEEIAEGNVSGHSVFSKIGYTPTMTTAISDVWGKAGVYTFPVIAEQWEVDSDSANDVGTMIFGNAEGAAQSILADTGSTLVSLYDASVDFTAGTAVAAGDCILLDPKGSNPEWGYVTGVTGAATGTLAVAGGFSNGGNPAGRAYTIVDKSGTTGAQVVVVDYLTVDYIEKKCLVITNGTTAVPIDNVAGTANSNTFKCNNFRVISAGSNLSAVGNIWLCDVDSHAKFISHINANMNCARTAIYSVPAGKAVYLTTLGFSFGIATATNRDYCRMFLRANREPVTGFVTNDLFYTCTEMVVQGNEVIIDLKLPVKMPEKTDIKISGISTAAGIASCYMRGWIENI